MKKVYFPVIVLLLAVFALFMLRSDPPANTPDPAQLTDPATFVLNQYHDLASLQKALDQHFPIGSDPAHLNNTLMRFSHMYSTGNLIENWLPDEPQNDWRLAPGTSTAENFTFYFRPLHPRGTYGWDEAYSGWAIKMTTEYQRKIIQVEALAVPNLHEQGKKNKHIQYVKELLQYIESDKPVDPFNKEEWLDLLAVHLSSPCRENLSDTCIAQQAFTLLGFPKSPLRFSYYEQMAYIAILINDKETAEKLLTVWPNEKEIRLYHDSTSRMQRMTKQSIDYDVIGHAALYMKLLLISGNMEEGMKHLKDLQERWGQATDYASIHALTAANRLSDAYRLAEMTFRWARKQPDGNIGSSAIMHCENYRHTLPESLGNLADAFIKAGDLEKASKLGEMLRMYLENAGFGQQSFCYLKAAQDAYIRTQIQIIEEMTRKNNLQSTASTLDELLSTLLTSIQGFQTEKWSAQRKTHVYKSLCKVALLRDSNGAVQRIVAAAEKAGLRNEKQYPLRKIDPIIEVYAACGLDNKVDTAFNAENPATHLPSDTHAIFKDYSYLANSLFQNGDIEIALRYARTALEKEKLPNNPSVETYIEHITLKIDMSQILQHAGGKSDSKKVLNEILQGLEYLDTLSPEEEWRKQTAFSKLALLHVQLSPMPEVLNWIEKLSAPFEWPQYFIINYLADNKDPAAFDMYMQSMSIHLKAKENANKSGVNLPPINPDLVNAYPILKSIFRVGSNYDGYAYKKEFKKRRRQGPVEKSQIDDIWPHLFSNCRTDVLRLGYNYKIKPNARETMAACYLDMLY